MPSVTSASLDGSRCRASRSISARGCGISLKCFCPGRGSGLGEPCRKTARMPASARPSIAASLWAGVGLLWHQSTMVVTPELSWLSAPTRLAMRISSGAKRGAIEACMLCRYSRIVQSPATPRSPVCQVWICALTKPGMTIMPRASTTWASAASSDGATATMRSSSISTSPCRRSPTSSSMATIMPPLISVRTMRSPGSKLVALAFGHDSRSALRGVSNALRALTFRRRSTHGGATMLAPRPLNPAEKLDWLRLIRSENVGPVTFYQLLARYGSAGAALEALPEVARRGGRDRALTLFPKAAAERELMALDRAGARLVAWGEPGYPAALAAIDDAPPLLSIRGDAEILQRPAIAVVGARNASANGRRFARDMALQLGQRGLVVVSGLARGIDTAAHEGAMPTGTVAVLAGGIDSVYPEENRELHEAIAERGAL